MMHSLLPRGRPAFAGVLAALLFTSACQDAPRIFEPAPLVGTPAVAALDAAQAELLSVALEDVISRVLHTSEDNWQSPLRLAIGELTADLAVADAATLGRRLSAAHTSAASQVLDPADADAVLLALAAIDDALEASRGR